MRRSFVLGLLGLLLTAPVMQAQGPSPRAASGARPPVTPSGQDTLIGRAVLGGATVVLLKGLAVPAVVGSVGWRMLQGQSLDGAVRTSVTDAKRLVDRAKPTVAQIDRTVSPVVGRTVRQGVRDAGQLIKQAAASPDRGLPPTP